ncbi:MAG: hypothetical protein JNM25_08295 [Planctomycetes bacterium]|nr:hypothetical protein [Planctomycetota bacterium]
MDDASQVRALLEQIRDLQQQHLAEYREQATRSLQLVEESVARQKAHIRLYQRVVAVGAVLIVVLTLFLLSYVR